MKPRQEGMGESLGAQTPPTQLGAAGSRRAGVGAGARALGALRLRNGPLGDERSLTCPGAHLTASLDVAAPRTKSSRVPLPNALPRGMGGWAWGAQDRPDL